MSTSSGPEAALSVLVGRQGELAALRAALNDARAGRGGLVLIGGEAGIGKTTLAEAILAEASGHGALVLVGRCYDLTETPPYGPWRELFAHAPRDPPLPELPIAVLPPDRVTRDGPIATHTIVGGVIDYLCAVATTRPLVVLLDDLHWADPASRDLLRVVARHLADRALLLLVTYRADEVERTHPLAELLPLLVREARAARLNLRPLDPEAIAAFVATRHTLAPADRDRLIAYLDARSEGHPLFLDELVRTLEEAGTLRDGNLGDLARHPVPPLLRQVIGERLARLGEETQQLLTVAAVIGQEVLLELWAAVAATSINLLLPHAERGLTARILSEPDAGGDVRFAHALIREVLYVELPAFRRRILHRQVAEALLKTPHPAPDVVANHLRRAGDPRAIGWHLRAGLQAAAAAANLSAVAHYQAAADLIATDPAQQNAHGWLLYLIGVLLGYEDGPRTIRSFTEAAQLARATDDQPLLAYSHFFAALTSGNHGGSLRGALTMMDQGLAELERLPAASRRVQAAELARARLTLLLLPEDRRPLPATSAPDLSAMLVSRGHAANWYIHAGRYRDAAPLAAATLAAALADDPDWLEAPGRWGHAHALAALGHPDAARQEYARTRADAYAAKSPYNVNYMTRFELLMVVLPYQADRPTERTRLAAEAATAWEEVRRTTISVPYPSQADLLVAIVDGRWAEARQLAEGGLLGMSGHVQGALAALGLLDRLQGNPAAAWGRVDTLLPAGPATAPGECFFIHGITMLALAAELALDAADPAASTWIAAHQRWLDWSGAVLWRSDQHRLLARHARQTGDLAAAREQAKTALAIASAPRQPLALLAARHVLGELDVADGQYARAQEHLDAALALADACAAPYERALTLLAVAELRAAEGRRDAAGTALAEACALLEPLVARLALARAAALAAHLAAATATLAPYPDGLSRREVEVLRFLAIGKSNREIGATLSLSPRTVQRHVANVYLKIGAHNKADATAYAFRHQLS
jgi:DNA-binding CsgD family transcriptional regulator